MEPQWTDLTPAQQAVLSELGRGLTNAEIAATLGWGHSTVSNTLARVYSECGFDNRVEAVLWTLRQTENGVYAAILAA